MKLLKHEHVDIVPWNKGYNEKPIDLHNPVDICNWCREMHKYRAEPNATSLIDRWCIGIYQLNYIPMLLKNPEPREFGEAIGSVFLHMIGVFENCDIDCYEVMDNNEYKSHHDTGFIYMTLLRLIPIITRQIYYKGKDRKNRFNKKTMEFNVGRMLNCLIALNNAPNPHLPISDSLMLAMAKVQEREFKTHG